MMIDTHCHIHDSEFAEKTTLTQDQIIKNAEEAGVGKLICVGTSLKSSIEARDFVKNRENCFFSIALHPHEAENYTTEELDKFMSEIALIAKQKPKHLVAIGECGLDYFYHDDAKVLKAQERLFRQHIDIAVENSLPLIFHIRDAFDDFFRIVDEYDGLSGVVHSFSATSQELDEVVRRGFYVGLNGIMTFTKDEKQLDAAKNVPIDKLVIETDAPFLTPKPFRGTINEPKHVINITKFLSELRDESQAFLAKQTTKNANTLFNL